MGYTSYWTPKASTPEQFKEFAEVCRLIKDACSNIPLANGLGDIGSDPIFSDTEIRFNGVGEESHETLLIAKDDLEWEFCKTARKPYDVVVSTILLAAEDMLGFKISSDGDIKPDGWKDNREGYQSPEHYDPCNWEKAKEIYESLQPKKQPS